MYDVVKLISYPDRLGAETAKSLLEASGIICTIKADDAGGMEARILTGTGGAWIIVRAEDANRATELLHFDEVDLEELEREALSHDPPADA